MSSPNAPERLTEIAIIGMAGRFPGARNVDEFWQNLRSGKESVSFFTEGELAGAGIKPDMLADPSYVKAKAILDDVELFDASFFGFTPREAEITDPQHRLFLECAWEALEQAGYDSENYQGLIGVYAGVGWNGYLLNLYSTPGLIESLGGFRALIGNDKDHLTTFVSYKLNLKGPSINVQSACSTSLVAVHLACQSLLGGECDIALAGGVSIDVPQKAGYLHREGGILSPDGHCRAFDARAQGTVGGSGAGIVVLKRLSDALADGDTIRATIKGSAINNDGSIKVGYTAPGVEGQAKVIAEALAVAGAQPETISYIEAHGTGTALGDPIELEALTSVFRAQTERKNFCAIGSVKTNIGHLDTASGVTGLIKTVLALENTLLPPSLHYEKPNPGIDFAGSPFYVNTRLSEWKAEAAPRRAGVSSFGIGGTNAHVIVEEAPPQGKTAPSLPCHLLVLSAKTTSALETATVNLVDHLKLHPGLNVADVAYTLHVGRRQFSHRRMLVCRDQDDAIETLGKVEIGRVFTGFNEPGDRPVVFMFPGQGAQYAGMAAELYETIPAFRLQADRCFELLAPLLEVDLKMALFSPEPLAGQDATRLDQTLLTQPLLFTIEYALAKMWMEWGVQPEAMIGHSVGEFVAACLSGVFSLEDALRLVASRSRLMQGLPGGAMVAVGLAEPELLPLLGDGLSLAAVNGSALCVVSGSTAAVDELTGRLAGLGVGCRRLRTSHAFHSEMLEPILEAFAAVVQRIDLKPPRIPYISNVTGVWARALEVTDPAYWVKHLRQTVRFAEGARELLKERERIFLEVGPGRTLCALIGELSNGDGERIALPTLRQPADQRSDVEFLLNTQGKLWLAGARMDWPRFYEHQSRRRVRLPTYPFERKSYWVRPVEVELIGINDSVNDGPEVPAYSRGDGLTSTQPVDAPGLPQDRGATVHPDAAEFANFDEAKLSAMLERLIAGQLQLMSQQLALMGEEDSRAVDLYSSGPSRPDAEEVLLTAPR